MILLSPERMQAIRRESNRLANNLANDTEGNFTQADIDSIYEEGDRAIAKAQAEVSLKEALDKAASFLDNIVDCYIPSPTSDHPHDLAAIIREDWQQLKKELEQC